MSPSSTSLPAATLRLFDGYPRAELERPEASDFVAERLLESGDRQDLRWLIRRDSEQALCDLVHRRGARALSTRSRRFWRLVLDGQLDSEAGVGADYWPLADS